MEQKVSNKITYLYFLMSILILNLHSVYMEQFQASELALVVASQNILCKSKSIQSNKGL